MKRQRLLMVMILFVLGLSISSEGLAAPYFEGKKIKMIIGSEPGGGYDRIGRILARHLPKYIPGKQPSLWRT